METLTGLAGCITTDQAPNRGTIDIAALRAAGIENDRERQKEKDIYLGSWGSGASSSSGGASSSSGAGSSSSSNSSSSSLGGTSIKVAISRVFDVLKGHHTIEVSVSSPTLTDVLKQLQNAGIWVGVRSSRCECTWQT